MRHMPTRLTGIGEIPDLNAAEWNTQVSRLIGRPTTPEEKGKIEMMARHNWTARVVAESIIGRDLTPEEINAAF